MGVESRKAPPLPAPTETDSLTTPTEVATDVSRTVEDEKSSYSLPEDGTPVTIKTRGHKANRSQTSLLIEYFEGGKPGHPGAPSGERKPSVRVRLTPSKNRKHDHIQITETRSSTARKASLSRRQSAQAAPATPGAGRPEIEALSTLSVDRDDAKSMSSYASATEESNVSRNPIEVDIDRSGRRRRPASPLIPAADSKVSYQAPTNMSDISAIPTDSFLDGSGPSKLGDDWRSKSPSRAGDVLAGAAAGLAVAAAAAADKVRSKSRSESRDKDRVSVSKSGDRERPDRKHRSSKSRGSSVSDLYSEDARSSRRRSSRGNQESVVSGADSSVLSSALTPSHRSVDQQSVRSGASKTSINNPKLLETVEDAIRRLILPELNALKREQSRHKDRRGSATSSATSASRDEYAGGRRQADDKYLAKSRESLNTLERRDREARNDLAESPALGVHEDDYEESLHSLHETPRRSSDKLKAAAAGAALGGLAVAALDAKSPAGAREQRRRRRAELKSRDKVSEDHEETEHPPAPPMPLMSEVNPSEVTRTSILSAETDRPHSASEELTPVRDVTRGVASAEFNSPTPTRTPVNLQTGLGTQHANISHGDLKALPRRRTGEYPESYEEHEYEMKAPVPTRDEYDEDEEYEAGMHPYAEPGLDDYYNTQDVPPPLKYVPYQPERRGLSPIPSVSGYTEGGSEPPNRDSRVTQNTDDSYPSPRKRDVSPHSASSAPSNIMGRESDLDDRSVRSSALDYRNTAYTDDSELGRETPGQAVRAVDANNPNIIHPGMGVESNVASLVDGSMLDDSVLTGESGRGSQGPYAQRESMATLEEEQPHRHPTPSRQSVESRREAVEEDSSISARERSGPSPGFEEYDLDEYGHKVPKAKYRQSPTESEAVITGAAVGAAAAALRAAKGRPAQASVEDESQEWAGEGVQRNKSFKERTKEGYLPANTPTHSIDRLDEYDRAKVGHSGLPDPNDPLPELGYFGADSELQTNPSLVEGRLDGTHEEEEGNENWTREPGVMEESDEYAHGDEHHKDLAAAAAAGAAVGAAAAAVASHSRQSSQGQEEEWQRTDDDRKRDTLVTNPYEGSSPIANLPGLNDQLLGGGGGGGYDTAAYAANYNVRSPLGHKAVDEGYISQGPNKTPDMQTKGKGVEFSEQPNMAGVEDPFYTGPKHSRHLSGMSQGMESPLYDPATGGGIDRIESKDIIALMQHLMVRDAQRSARDTEILVTLVRSAAEMRNSFEDIRRMLADTEDVIITEVKENTEKTVQRAIGGPRPFPGSAKSIQATSLAGTDDLRTKKQNLFRRALNGLSAKGTNDLTRIEDMLMQLLTEVDVLKAQTAPGASPTSAQGNQSYDNLQPAVQYEQDRGYEPEGNAGTSTASHASQSGQLSTPPAAKLPYVERKFSDHRISTVPEDNEDEYDYSHLSGADDNPDMMLGAAHDAQRAGSVPLGTPPQPSAAAQGSLSNENTPRTEKGKKHKSSGSSSWFPKISRWSETTASSVGKAFRSSRSNKDNDGSDFHNVPSRSGSDLAQYDYGAADPYDEDKLHTGFSEQDLRQPMAGRASPMHHQPPPATYMTPEDPKYKAHRNSLNLLHPQPRPGQTELFRTALETQAQDFDSPMSPRSADWAGSATSLHRFPAQHHHRYTNSNGGEVSTDVGDDQYWGSSPAAGGSTSQAPPRPPKEPLEGGGSAAEHRQTPPRSNRISKLAKGSPLPYHSVESGYGTATHGAPTSYTGSPKLENRNLSGALGVPARRPSGPRAMTPKSVGSVDSNGEEGGDGGSARRRKRDTFGTLASDNTDTF